jgi:O-acetyl-ADP-ribose deacetylase (regulator of RNase III)
VTAISYVRGDATHPLGRGNKIICHCCNDRGRWGKGFVLALSKKWAEPEEDYRRWYRERDGFRLGEVRLVRVEPRVWVANMIGQHGTRRGSGGPPVRYPALGQCLDKLAVEAAAHSASVHMPRIGCGLAGGRWELVEPLICASLVRASIPVTVYEFE